MIWLCRLLCPNDHCMIAGVTQAPPEESADDIARSFIGYVHDTLPELDCDQGCNYKLNRESLNIEVRVHVESIDCRTIEQAYAALRQDRQQLKLQEFFRRSRN